MSYSVIVYRLCLEKLRSILGSGDAVLQREVETAYAQDICRNNEWFARQIEGGAPRLEEALAAVIHGKPLAARETSQCWYAAELLARYLGKRIGLGSLEGVSSFYLDEVGRLLTTALNIPPHLSFPAILDRAPPLSLPAPNGFPYVGYLTAKECGELSALLHNVDLEQLQGDRETVEGVDDYISLVETVAGKEDVVLFYY